MDDDPGILKSVTRCLEEAGFEVHATKHSAKAARMAEQIRPALAILDISMPERDGLELAELIRSRSKTNRTRVMFLTAQQAAEHIQEAKDTGALGYLEKPFRPKDLLRMVRELLSIPVAPKGTPA